jgi:hypothetical protein
LDRIKGYNQPVVARNHEGRELDDDGIIRSRFPSKRRIEDAADDECLYPDARKKFPTLPSTSVATLEQAVQKTYRAKRYEAVWTNAASLPTYRYPTPFPTPNQSWSVSIVEQRPIVSLRIGEKRMAIKLKGGPRFWRQLASVRQIDSGAAVKGQLDIYEQGAKLMCKMVAWLPREQQAQEKTGILVARTGTDWILAAFSEKGERVWLYNGDHVRRFAMQHVVQLQRWSEDQKPEQRPIPSFSVRRKEAVDRYHRRMTTACHEISSMLVNYAERRNFAVISYDDRERGFVKQFQWFRLNELIEEKCNTKGILFKKVSGEVPETSVIAHA